MTSSNDESSSKVSLGQPIKISTLISAVGIGVFMSSLDASIVVVILEKIQQTYAVGPSQVQWVLLSYLLVMMAFTVIAGDLGDKISNKRIYQIGMILFGLGSLMCFFALDFLTSSIYYLLIGRVIQSFGATSMIANGMAIVTRLTTVKNRGTAVGLNNFIISIAVILGPVFGTVIAQYWTLGGVFLVNVPLSLIGFFLVQFHIPPTIPFDDRRHADYLGSILFALFLTTLILSFSIFPETEKIPNARMWSGITLGFSLLILPFFILWERKSTHPLIDFSLLKNKKISIGLTTAVLKHQGYIVIIYQFSLFLPKFGITKTPIELGLVLAGVALGMALFAGISGKLSNTIDARYLCTIAMFLVALTDAMLAIFISVNAPLWLYVLSSTVIGICIGLFQSPNGNSTMSAAPKEKLGITSALLGLTTSVGINLGTALSTAILVLAATTMSNINGFPAFDATNYTIGLKWVFAVFAVITALGAIFSYFRGPEERIDKTITDS
ncbi:MAG: MFS transporter [Candidatus Heimdallarchaeaceae archaeon]